MLSLEQTELLRSKVNAAYSSVAAKPEDKHPLPVGKKLAENLGYPCELLAGLPQVSVEAFAGVSNVSLFAELPLGSVVLDLGCGAAMDSIIAAKRVGPTGRVIGIDFSDSMLERARCAKQSADLLNLAFHPGDAETLPLANSSVDVALVNGIFNLNPLRKQIFSELARVVRPGGSVYAAELILARPLPESERIDENNWFA